MTVEPGSLRIGTMGWTYKDWSGTFYARDADRKELLRYYPGSSTPSKSTAPSISSQNRKW